MREEINRAELKFFLLLFGLTMTLLVLLTVTINSAPSLLSALLAPVILVLLVAIGALVLKD